MSEKAVPRWQGCGMFVAHEPRQSAGLTSLTRTGDPYLPMQV